MAGHVENQGALHCVPHGDGNQRTFITVPIAHPSLPSGSHFVPSALPKNVRHALLGRLERRKAPVSGLTWVQPRPLAGYLAALGHGGVSNILKGAHTDTIVPLLTRQALRELGREDLWPADWPPPPPAPLPPLPPGIQFLRKVIKAIKGGVCHGMQS